MHSICFFNTNKVWGGGEKWHFEVARWFALLGHKVLVYGYPGKELVLRAEENGISNVQVKVSNLDFLNPFKIWFLARSFKRNRVDTIFLNLSSDVKTAGLAAKMAGVERIIYRRGMALPVGNNILNRFLFKKVLTKIIVNSNDIGNKIIQNHAYLKNKGKIELVYNGVDIGKYSPKMKRKESCGAIIFGNVGRMVEQKAQHYLIELAAVLKKMDLSFKIQIAGNGVLEEDLKNLSHRLNVEDCVEFLGFIDNLNEFYQTIDVFILTSLHEGSSNAAIEAMAWGNPMIVFDVSSMPEFVQHGKNGFLVKNGDMEGLADSACVLINDEELRKTMGENSFKMVMERFDFNNNLKGLYSKCFD